MEFCDLKCRHAQWPTNSALDGSGSCRTFQALFCEKKDRFVHKNAPCAEKEKQEPHGAKREAHRAKRMAHSEKSTAKKQRDQNNSKVQI
jgi:hypothetical protein